MTSDKSSAAASEDVVIGFSVTIEDDDIDLLDDCVNDLLDDLEDDLDGEFDFIWWITNDHLAKGILYAPMRAKKTIKQFSRDADDLTAKTLSAQSVIDNAKKMSDLRSSVESVTSSVEARQCVKRWMEPKSDEVLPRLVVDSRPESMSWSEFMKQSVMPKIEKIDWNDVQ